LKITGLTLANIHTKVPFEIWKAGEALYRRLGPFEFETITVNDREEDDDDFDEEDDIDIRWEANVPALGNIHHEVEIIQNSEGKIWFAYCHCDEYDYKNLCQHVCMLAIQVRAGYITSTKVETERLLTQARELLAQNRAPQTQILNNTMQEKMGIARFTAIMATVPELERYVVMTLALRGRAQNSLQRIFELLKEAQTMVGGKSIRVDHVKAALDGLAAKKLIKKELHAISFDFGFDIAQEYCYGLMGTDKGFEHLANTYLKAEAYSSVLRQDYYAYFANCMSAAFYFKDYPKFRQCYIFLMEGAGSSTNWTVEQFTKFWLPNNTPSELMREKADPRILLDILEYKVVEDTVKLLDCSENVALMHHYRDIVDMTPEMMMIGEIILTKYYFLRGQWDAYQASKQKLGDIAVRNAFEASEKLLMGDLEGALEQLALAEKLNRKETRSTKAVLSGWGLVFQVLALLKRNQIGDLDKALYVLEKTKTPKFAFQPSVTALLALCAFFKNDKKSAQYYAFSQISPSVDSLFNFLANFTVELGNINIGLKTAQELVVQARQNGYHWVADELEYLVSPSENATKHPNGFVKLGTLFPRTEEWENALNLLLTMSAPSDAKKVAGQPTENQTRLVWMVDFQRPSVEAKEQTHGKKGWTLGKVVSNTRLNSRDIKGLTTQDAHIIDQLFRKDYYYAYYSPNWDRVWPEMVGHPLLFLQKSPTVGVQLEKQDPVITAKAKPDGSGYYLAIAPPVTKVGTQIIKETPTRYKVVIANEQHLKIAQALGEKGLEVPEKGFERFSEAVTSLANIVHVQTSVVLANEEVPEVPSEPRTCVHLLPVGNGFHVELYAKPFGSIAPYFKPGDGDERAIAVMDGQRVQTKRNLKAEVANAKELIAKIPALEQKSKKVDHTWELEDGDDCLNFLTEVHPFIQSKAIILEWPKGEKYKVVGTIGTDAFRMQVREKGHWFQVDGSVQVDENRVLNMLELLDLADRQRSPFIEVAPGQFMALTKEFRDKLRAVQGLVNKEKSGQLTVHNLATGALSVLTDAVQQAEFDEKFKQQKTRIQEAFGKKYKVPKYFNATLRPYQEEGFQWLHRLNAWGVGACLADDMGLGKTIQALAFLTDRAKDGPALVVAPLSVSRNWMRETEKFAPLLKPILFGEGERESTIKKATKGDLVVVTYDLLARESEMFIKKKWSTIILDEAQAIKNRSTKRSETAMQLQGSFKIVMSGTPVENHLGELWNLFQFANPGLLGSLDQFNERFALPIEKHKDEDRRNTLRRLVQPFILRRRKDEVLKDLPAKTEITLRVELSDEERSFYEALRRKALLNLEGETQANAGEQHLMILAEIMKLRRAACHPRLADAHAGVKESAKEKLFAEIVEELVDNGHKALVFSQFVSHLDILKKVLKRMDVPFQYLDGQTPPKTRQKNIDAFQNGEGDIFLISLKAGGTGLNLTAADYVIHMDPWWNPAVEDQATDRAHRIGQLKPVTVYRFVAENTIEDKIIQLHEQKRDLADSLLNGTGASAKLTAEQLMELLKS
jgi:superfamily II DNA or RNA helicase